MNPRLKALFVILMTTALAFGFLHQFLPHVTLSFDRLHIFLFNLCSGGTIVLFYTEKQKRLSAQATAFLIISLCYALLAFAEHYAPAIVCSLILALIVERIRIRAFSFFPWDFFSAKVPVAKKFNQASLLCLSLALLISSVVIVNNEFTHWVSIPKLQLNTFFLGFSFPLSLITMSAIFAIMKPADNPPAMAIRNLCFWTVNLGVITFFVFILMETLAPQVVVTLILFASVATMLYLFVTSVNRLQQKAFLVSGMGFLLYTALSGIAYILLAFHPAYYDQVHTLLIKVHSFAALYGWNLSGLAVIVRYDDFPIRLHSPTLILGHWIIVAVLAPMGYYYPLFAMLATLCYGLLLCMFFLTKGKNRGILINHQGGYHV